ncbi:MAG TPA: 5'/3'-nucleotidase SurE [Chloroflexota bacterium]|nr:5'/3'-nucleotidase SurE [Chloroflexota bacterium]
MREQNIGQRVEGHPYILVTNDDGIDSEGLLVLKRALAAVGEVVVVAPDRDWSIIGHAKTMRRPLRVARVSLPDGDPAFSVDGTPTDCVSLGVLGLVPRRPNLVVAGINKGPNLGEDITYSGTVAAAMESAIAGIPSIAVSLADYYDWDFAVAAQFTAKLARRIVGNGLGADVLLNVNVPNVTAERIAGVEITRLGRRIYKDVLEEREDSSGRSYYLIGGDFPGGVAEEGTDYNAVQGSRISVTPIHLDLTNHRLIKTLERWNLQAD